MVAPDWSQMSSMVSVPRQQRQDKLTDTAVKKESSEVTVAASSSWSLWKLSILGKIRVPSLSGTNEKYCETRYVKLKKRFSENSTVIVFNLF